MALTALHAHSQPGQWIMKTCDMAMPPTLLERGLASASKHAVSNARCHDQAVKILQVAGIGKATPWH